MQPRRVSVTTEAEVQKALEYVGLPVAVKSATRSSGRGVAVVETEDECRAAVRAALGSPFVREVVLEEVQTQSAA